MSKKLTILTVALLALSSILPSVAQMRQNTTYQRYIATYAGMAQDQMRRYGIPASVTLSQGLLESAAGQSTLAITANNHFGIKVGSGWTGPYVLRDDDKPNEKFRKYSSVAESYEDHSLFLKNNSRYSNLFSLSTTDYKGWAKGLKACGYATSSTYAQNLINIIELYSLHQYDTGGKGKRSSTTGSVSHQVRNTGAASVMENRDYGAVPGTKAGSISDLIHFCNGKRYVIVQPGETWRSLSRWYGISASKLRKRNEYPEGVEPTPGTPIYLDKKATRAAKAMKGRFHEVQPGESLHSISQMYGMKMKTLYKVNELPWGYAPKVGDRLLLR